MTAPRCPCCPDGIMQDAITFQDGFKQHILVCRWCGHTEDDTTPRRATTLAASQRQFHVEG